MSIGIELATQEQIRAKIAWRLEGRAHWILLVQPNGVWLLEEIEKRFYSGTESSSDFEAYMSGHLGAIAVLHKRRMSRRQFMDLLASECEVSFPRGFSPEADITVLASGATLDEQAVILRSFSHWIKG